MKESDKGRCAMNFYKGDKKIFTADAFGSRSQKNENNYINIQNRDIVFHKTYMLDPADVVSVARQAAACWREIGAFAPKPPSFFEEQMHKENCLVCASRGNLMFFTCLYALSPDVCVLDNILIHEKIWSGYFCDILRRFVEQKKSELGTKNMFALALRHKDGTVNLNYGVFLARVGFAHWVHTSCKEQGLLKLLQKHDGLDELLEEVYSVYVYNGISS